MSVSLVVSALLPTGASVGEGDSASGMSSARAMNKKEPPPNSRRPDTWDDVRLSCRARIIITPRTAEMADKKLNAHACECGRADGTETRTQARVRSQYRGKPRKEV